MKELWLFTRQFPAGRGEVFLSTALKHWRGRFGRIRVLPMFWGEGHTDLPAGVEVVQLWADAFAPMPWPEVLRNAPRAWGLWAQRGPCGPRAGGTAQQLAHLRQLLRRMSLLEAYMERHHHPDRVVMLSAWMEDWTTLLAWLRHEGREVRFRSMAHRTDLFEGPEHGGAIPWRELQLHGVEEVLCIARDGLDALRHAHPAAAHKLVLTPLGTEDHGPGVHRPGEVLRLLSCSAQVPRKRVGRIAEVLARVRRPVLWTHLGDGPDRPLLERVIAALPPHIRVDLRGHVPNPAVQEVLRTEPFDLFIHLSAHEGLPVALMEAASFGIPLLAADGGGVRELVGPSTGILVPVDASLDELAALLDGDAMDRLRTPAFRSGVREAWQQRFEAAAAYGRIAERLLM